MNAFQRLSQVIIQKSRSEGFGLVVSEAMWKSRCDPICGMMLGADDRMATLESRAFRFCSELCLNQFLREPER